MSSVLLETRPFRPFKSSEEYLYAMKEDLAEWLQTMYPHLNISVDNFMEKLETGVALCEHANAVKAQAHEYVEKKQAKKIMTRSVTGSLAIAQTLVHIMEVKYFNTAKPGTFFARDNVSNFINWCRKSLRIIECLLFESDDLIMRKNEKHVILCLLEVARRGAKFGMLAPLLVQMERQIDKEIAADQKKMGVICNENQNGLDDDSDSDLEDEDTVLMYGPVPQIITNDLKSLDEMVRDLVEKCTCPTQFPMIRVSEGKYRIGDTKVLIFVRILRNHVMVRVGGGWDTLAHYLDKHDPCRCRTQHRTTQSARLVNRPGMTDLHGSHVYYDRAPAVTQDYSSLPNTNTYGLGPPLNTLNRSRSRSPTHQSYADSRRSVSPNFSRKSLVPPVNRSRSPTPNFTSTYTTKLSSTNQDKGPPGPHSLPFVSASPKTRHISTVQIPPETKVLKSEATLQLNDTDQSDTTSEMSDEGYRSLGIVQDKNRKPPSLYSQNSTEDADENEHQHVYTEEELNDYGLRKTKFSQKMYDNDLRIKLEKNLQSIEKLTESPTDTPDDDKEFIHTELLQTNSKRNAATKQKEKPFNLQKSKIEVRSNSVDRKSDITKSPNKTSGQSKKTESKINTWNGRNKSSRPSLTTETYVSPFARNFTARRSVSAVSYDRRSSSAKSSPTKGKLKQELLHTVSKSEDDETIAIQVQELLKKYGSLNTLNSEDVTPTPPTSFSRTMTRASFRSPRKDSRPENNISRIPAPVAFSHT